MENRFQVYRYDFEIICGFIQSIKAVMLYLFLGSGGRMGRLKKRLKAARIYTENVCKKNLLMIYGRYCGPWIRILFISIRIQQAKMTKKVRFHGPRIQQAKMAKKVRFHGIRSTMYESKIYA